MYVFTAFYDINKHGWCYDADRFGMWGRNCSISREIGLDGSKHCKIMNEQKRTHSKVEVLSVWSRFGPHTHITSTDGLSWPRTRLPWRPTPRGHTEGVRGPVVGGGDGTRVMVRLWGASEWALFFPGVKSSSLVITTAASPLDFTDGVCQRARECSRWPRRRRMCSLYLGQLRPTLSPQTPASGVSYLRDDW